MNPRAYLDVITDVVGDFMEPFVPTVTMTAYYGNQRIVTNIPGGTQGMEFMPYDVPNPEVGVHRNVMLLYKQKSRLNGIDTLQSRVCFKSSDFADMHNLEKPAGITYFYVRRQPRRNA